MSLPSLAIYLGFLSFGILEMLVIAMVALLIFGGELPDAMRSLGRAYGKLRRALDEVSKPVREEIKRTGDLSADLPSPRQTARELDAEVRRAGTKPKSSTPDQDDAEGAESEGTATKRGSEDEGPETPGAAPWPASDEPPSV